MPTRLITAMVTLIACPLVLLVSSVQALEKSAPGTTWIGEYRLDGVAVPILLHTDGQDASAALDLPARGERGVPLKNVLITAARTRFDLQGGRHLYSFNGERSGDAISGRLTQGERQGSFSLLQLRPASPALARELAGSYQLAPDHVIDIGPMDEMGGQLVFQDQKTRRTGPLYGLSPTRFVSGPAIGIPFPLQIQAGVVRDQNGAVTALNWQDEQGGATAVRIAPHRVEDITVLNRGVALKGTLSLPLGPGPHPAVVFAHGSGDSTRNVGVWNSFFLRQGMAVLSLDKRGAGQSGGDWHTASLQDIAADWLAGVA